MADTLGDGIKKTTEVIERARETNFGLMTTVVGLSASAIGFCVVSGKLPPVFAVLFDIPILLSLAQQWCIREAREKDVESEGHAIIIRIVEAFPDIKKDPETGPSVRAAAKGMATSGQEIHRWFKYAKWLCSAGVISFALTSLAAVLWFAISSPPATP